MTDDAAVTDDLTAYVALELRAGRRLFDVLADAYVLERADEYVSVLDHLGRDPAIRSALAGAARASHIYRLSA
jgi:hypothetical protein